MWNRVARFIGTHNITLQTAVSLHLRNLLEFVFQESYHQGSRLGPEPAEAAFKAFCPVQKATVLRERIVRVATQDRDFHKTVLSRCPYCASSMDAGQVGHVKLFVINLVESNVPLYFTENMMKIYALNCLIIRDILVQTIRDLAQKSIRVPGVLCDGARYQVKAFDCTDSESVQFTADEL
jgi:hypothetical protein